jgi:hypothetical protein|tara:strand:- start:369 stop:494 length:126 start_codon:yes stop_codon:yes gene_type:complete
MKRDGLVEKPWPKPHKNVIKIIMMEEFKDMHDMGIDEMEEI